MTGHGAKFARKKEAAVAALLTHRNIEEAADAVGIAPKTLIRWTKEPEFRKLLPGSPASSVWAIGRSATTGFGGGRHDSTQSDGGLEHTGVHESASRR
jgi:hypothetical protein